VKLPEAIQNLVNQIVTLEENGLRIRPLSDMRSRTLVPIRIPVTLLEGKSLRLKA
jgi:hypothetical protein